MKLSTVLMCAEQQKQHTLDLHRSQKYFLSCSLQRCAFTNSLANTFLPIIFCFTKLVSTLYFVCVCVCVWPMGGGGSSSSIGSRLRGGQTRFRSRFQALAHQRLEQWSSTRGPPCGIMRAAEDFWNTQILNKIRAGIDKLLKEKQCQVSHQLKPDIMLFF